MTRPTSDRLRETLFNVLASRIEGARFLDLYAGSGAVGMEALSRGAAEVAFVERAPAALKALRTNLDRLGFASEFHLHAMAVASWLKQSAKGAHQTGFDLVFLDPPYELEKEYMETMTLLGGGAAFLLEPHAWVIAEHRKKDRLAEQYGTLTRFRLLEQGDAALSFYAVSSQG